MFNIHAAEKSAHRKFTKLIKSHTAAIYTDTCFHLPFILRHGRELQQNGQRVKVTKSVQLELGNKNKQVWAKRKLNTLRKSGKYFELLPGNKQERRRIYTQKLSAYADEGFVEIFSKDSPLQNVLLTGDYALAQKLAGISSTVAVFFQYSTADSGTHVVLWSDYQKKIGRSPVEELRHRIS